jgi:GTPase
MQFSEVEFKRAVETIQLAAKPNITTIIQTRMGPLKRSATDDVEKSNKLGMCGHVLIRKVAQDATEIIECRIAVVGNVDSGKSTTLGTLTKGVLDDGRGKTRVSLFRHRHEITTGRTSSVGLEIMGFDAGGKIITAASEKQKLTWEDVCDQSSKILGFADLAGHERYLKTTVFGMTAHAVDVAMLMVAANNGLIGMAKEHLGLGICLNIPMFVVITKIDLCPLPVKEATINQLTKILKSSGCRKIPIFVNYLDDVIMSATSFVSERICPVFQISNVTGEGLDLLKSFLNLIHSAPRKYDVKQPAEFIVTDNFSVPGVGTVVSGTLMQGTVAAGDSLYLGPDSSGQFIPVQVKSLQRKRVNIPVAHAGQSVSFALKKIKRSSLRKGMYLLQKSKDGEMPRACRDFEAEVVILLSQTTITAGRYQAMLHCGSVRQTARIVEIKSTNKDGTLRTGDRAIVHFQFLSHAEWMKPGSKLLFREGRTKGLGKVTRCLFQDTIVAPSPPTFSTKPPNNPQRKDLKYH